MFVYIFICLYLYLALWCNAYHYCATSFIKAWTQVLRRLKSCSPRIGDSRWWGFLKMVPAGNKAKCLPTVNHTTKRIHHHHHHHYRHHHIFENFKWMYKEPDRFLWVVFQVLATDLQSTITGLCYFITYLALST